MIWEDATSPTYRNGPPALEYLEANIKLLGDFGCWIWTGRNDGRGYGLINVGSTEWRVHRFSYALHRDDIPAGLTLDHLCRVTACVNPWHLEPVPASVNVRRRTGFDDPRQMSRARAAQRQKRRNGKLGPDAGAGGGASAARSGGLQEAQGEAPAVVAGGF